LNKKRLLESKDETLVRGIEKGLCSFSRRNKTVKVFLNKKRLLEPKDETFSKESTSTRARGIA
jgi:hypothetical protein